LWDDLAQHGRGLAEWCPLFAFKIETAGVRTVAALTGPCYGKP